MTIISTSSIWNHCLLSKHWMWPFPVVPSSNLWSKMSIPTRKIGMNSMNINEIIIRQTDSNGILHCLSVCLQFVSVQGGLALVWHDDAERGVHSNWRSRSAGILFRSVDQYYRSSTCVEIARRGIHSSRRIRNRFLTGLPLYTDTDHTANCVALDSTPVRSISSF